jgi:hypothetical protein
LPYDAVMRGLLCSIGFSALVVGCADAPASAPPAQTAAEIETTGTALVVASVTATASTEAGAVISASKPPALSASAVLLRDAKADAIAKQLIELDVQLEALNSAGSPSRSLTPGGAPPNLLDQAASRGAGTGELRMGGSGRGGGSASIGEGSGATSGGKIGNKIGGKMAGELTVADLEKALGAAGCTTARIDSPYSSSGAPQVAMFEAKCADKTFNVTFVPAGVARPDAKRIAEMDRLGATWSESEMLLAIIPKDKDGRPAALELMKKLRSSDGVKGNAAIGGAAVAGGSVSNTSSVVAGMAAGFRRCYSRGLQEDPNMKGSMKVTAGIGPNGEVVSSTASGGGGLSEAVMSCVTARVAAAQFAAPDGGKATIVIPVSFFPAQ